MPGRNVFCLMYKACRVIILSKRRMIFQFRRVMLAVGKMWRFSGFLALERDSLWGIDITGVIICPTITLNRMVTSQRRYSILRLCQMSLGNSGKLAHLAFLNQAPTTPQLQIVNQARVDKDNYKCSPLVAHQWSSTTV